MNKFPCGVKHNFNSGVIIKSDDRKNYDWNCVSCELKEKILSKEILKDFKPRGKILCPLLTYE
ncbi:MAG: hypothetical protein ACFFEY_08395 [Candidatus Thorarchaeota archaeon]